jgi:hypothetical protein
MWTKNLIFCSENVSQNAEFGFLFNGISESFSVNVYLNNLLYNELYYCKFTQPLEIRHQQHILRLVQAS